MPQPARLTSDLLARKGHALPAGGFAHPAFQPARPSPLDLLGQACCGRPAPDADLQDRTPEPAVLPIQPRVRGAHRPHGRVALTLRLDRERYVRLKIFAARRARTGQDVLLKALDAYLDACGADCACLRGKAAVNTN